MELCGDLLKTVNFSAYKHRNQRRKGGENVPYINHPIGVAMLLWENGVRDLATIQGAILHDTVEDTDTTIGEIRENFGEEVAGIVADVTDDKSLRSDMRKKHQVEHAPHINTKSKLVKLADKLYNLKELTTSQPHAWTVERTQGYFVWAHAVINGLRGNNEGLERALDEVFAGSFVTPDGNKYPVLPPGVDLNSALENYYRLMASL